MNGLFVRLTVYTYSPWQPRNSAWARSRGPMDSVDFVQSPRTVFPWVECMAVGQSLRTPAVGEPEETNSVRLLAIFYFTFMRLRSLAVTSSHIGNKISGPEWNTTYIRAQYSTSCINTPLGPKHTH